MKCDLHLHTTMSDGGLAPSKLIDRVKWAGISFCAVTDHDTVAGVDEAVKRGTKIGVDVIRGVELSTYLDKEYHILGYGMAIDDAFKKGINDAKQMRKERNIKIFARLNQLGIRLNAKELGKDGVKGRLHIAKLLVKKGYATSVNEAFDKYLGANGLAYVKSERFKPIDAIRLIRGSGGIPVLAHPGRIIEEDDFDDWFKDMVDVGLGGVEVYYPSHTELERVRYAELANYYGLIKTGGSDFHSDTGGNKIGSADAELNIETIEILKNTNNRLRRLR